MKTDCLLTPRLPQRFAERLRALEALRHPDGTPVYRVEETKPLLGSSRAPRMEAERPKQRTFLLVFLGAVVSSQKLRRIAGFFVIFVGAATCS